MKQYKKIMIYGDPASGKSTFANMIARNYRKLLLHTDTIRYTEKNSKLPKDIVIKRLKLFLKTYAEWVIEGNIFKVDPTDRIQQADIIFVFDFPIHRTFLNIAQRWWSIKKRVSDRIGSNISNKKLNLKYFIPYILIRFPKRKREAYAYINEYHKQNIVIFTSYKDIDTYITNLEIQK